MMKFYGPSEAGTIEKSRDASDIRVEDLTPSEQKALQEKASALQQLLGDPDIAKYKIEILFDKRKSRKTIFPGVMTVWKSGSVLSGGGDEILYPCPKDKCKGYLGSSEIASMSGTAYCPECQIVWNTSDLMEARLFVLDIPKWAFVISREFLRTNCLADIYMKMTSTELRELAKVQNKGGEPLAKARDRSFVMYRLQDVLRDVNAGSSIESRIRAFLEA